MVCEALRTFKDAPLDVRFVANVDATDLREATRDLDPQATLFIVASKSFTTIETMTNAESARAWCLGAAARDPAAVGRHFVAVSSDVAKASEFGIAPDHVFPLPDWVGGRYSVDSAIGLPVMLAIGADAFRSLLDGMHAMDEHFRTAAFPDNLPVLMGLLTVWYADFFRAETVAIIPYSHALRRFPAFIQQLVMESNGKRVTLDGTPVEVPTSPIVWGEPGTNAQHSFFQLLHQGTHLVPCDFIGFANPVYDLGRHQALLVANLFAQAEALAFGKTAAEVAADGVPAPLVAHRTFDGNRPSSTIMLEGLTPAALGKLIALYEHSVFTQSVIWNINAFDQWGVELGKVLAQRVVRELEADIEPELAHDSSTNALIRRYRAWRRSRR
jgi:glucose-6-phosphate isomerase